MAHFAELNSSNEVLRVVVISNDDVAANGGDLHADAEAFVKTIVPHSTGGNTWKQTSYNNNFRKQYAGIGDTFDASKNKFIKPKPFPSWSLDSNDDWEAPVTYPTVTEIDSEKLFINWDEANQKWLGKTYTGDGDETITNYEWDATNTEWNEV
jgi:hypothetical protein